MKKMILLSALESLAPGVADMTIKGVEAGGWSSAGGLGLLANVQHGTGLGILSDVDQGETESTNYFAQASWKFDKLKLGVSYGVSENDEEGVGTRGLKSNANLTVGGYYALNSLITLVAEVGQTRSKAFAGQRARMNGAAVGGIIFF